MKILEILTPRRGMVLIESYSTAKQVFGREANAEEVGKRLSQFKDLSQRNILKPEEKDLTKWIKSGWKSFNDFVAQSINRKSGNEQKKAQKGDSIRVSETDDWLVVIPLTKAASCFYGRDTQWCTAATKSENYFDSYFTDEGVTLFYFINKKDGEKLAAAVHADNESIECFDERDNSIHVSELSARTGVKRSQLEKWCDSHMSTMNNTRDKSRNSRRMVTGLLGEITTTVYDLVGYIDYADNEARNGSPMTKADTMELFSGPISDLKALLPRVQRLQHSVAPDSKEADVLGQLERICSDPLQFVKDRYVRDQPFHHHLPEYDTVG